MKTGNDRLFCTLVSSEGGIKTGRITCYMYLFQLAGFELNFRYKVANYGVKSNDFNQYLSEAINQGVLNTNRGIINVTIDIEEAYLKYPLGITDLNLIENIKSFLDALSDDDLTFLCLTDIIVSDTKKKVSVNKMAEERTTIESVLKGLSPVFSEENFDTSLKVIRFIKEGKYEELVGKCE